MVTNIKILILLAISCTLTDVSFGQKVFKPTEAYFVNEFDKSDSKVFKLDSVAVNLVRKADSSELYKLYINEPWIFEFSEVEIIDDFPGSSIVLRVSLVGSVATTKVYYLLLNKEEIYAFPIIKNICADGPCPWQEYIFKDELDTIEKVEFFPSYSDYSKVDSLFLKSRVLLRNEEFSILKTDQEIFDKSKYEKIYSVKYE
ncbi:MAG: hypothetical protein MRY83_14680 [Flavobacteriales bacterium]|nr:hypothetical protein [Flavobacteriales bacterium]